MVLRRWFPAAKTFSRIHPLPPYEADKNRNRKRWRSWRLAHLKVGRSCVFLLEKKWPFSHNHGSVENHPKCSRKLILEGPFSHWTMMTGGRVDSWSWVFRGSVLNFGGVSGWVVKYFGWLLHAYWILYVILLYYRYNMYNVYYINIVHMPLGCYWWPCILEYWIPNIDPIFGLFRNEDAATIWDHVYLSHVVLGWKSQLDIGWILRGHWRVLTMDVPWYVFHLFTCFFSPCLKVASIGLVTTSYMLHMNTINKDDLLNYMGTMGSTNQDELTVSSDRCCQVY